jgi:hypothetical protein
MLAYISYDSSNILYIRDRITMGIWLSSMDRRTCNIIRSKLYIYNRINRRLFFM